MEKRSSKVVKTGSLAGAKGGSGKMSGRNSAGPQVPGQSASLGKGGGKFGAGGSAKMAGKQSATPAKAC